MLGKFLMINDSYNAYNILRLSELFVIIIS